MIHTRALLLAIELFRRSWPRFNQLNTSRSFEQHPSRELLTAFPAEGVFEGEPCGFPESKLEFEEMTGLGLCAQTGGGPARHATPRLSRSTGGAVSGIAIRLSRNETFL